MIWQDTPHTPGLHVVLHNRKLRFAFVTFIYSPDGNEVEDISVDLYICDYPGPYTDVEFDSINYWYGPITTDILGLS